MFLRTLTNAELARYANNQINELTSTALEVELLRRLEERAADDAEEEAVLERAAEFDLDADGIRKLGEALILNASNSAELLSAIGEAGFDSAAEVKREFTLAQQFRALASDAGDAFARLSTLTETATA